MGELCEFNTSACAQKAFLPVHVLGQKECSISLVLFATPPWVFTSNVPAFLHDMLLDGVMRWLNTRQSPEEKLYVGAGKVDMRKEEF